MEPRIGEFILTGRALVTAWPESAVDAELERRVNRAFVLGQEPTPEQDLSFGIIEISDIAVKALSPGVNDPTTALRCIDRLSDILLEIGRRREHTPDADPAEPARFLAQPVDFERLAGMAFDQIRHYGASNAIITRKLVDTLSQLLDLLPPDRHEPIRAQLGDTIEEARRAMVSPLELAGFERMLGREGVGAGTPEQDSGR